MKPGKKNKIENKKKAETTTNPFNLSEDEQFYNISHTKSVGPSFANIIVKLPAFEYFAADDIDSLIREICRTYASKIRRRNFKYPNFSYAFLSLILLMHMILIKF